MRLVNYLISVAVSNSLLIVELLFPQLSVFECSSAIYFKLLQRVIKNKLNHGNISQKTYIKLPDTFGPQKLLTYTKKLWRKLNLFLSLRGIFFVEPQSYEKFNTFTQLVYKFIPPVQRLPRRFLTNFSSNFKNTVPHFTVVNTFIETTYV